MNTTKAARQLLLLALSGTAASTAWAGTNCQMLDSSGNPIGNGGSNPGAETGDQERSFGCGRNVNTANPASVALGTNVMGGARSVSIGVDITSTASSSVNVGFAANTSQPFSLAIGAQARSTNWGSVALGASSTASGNFSTASGYLTTASGLNSIAVGGFYGNQNTGIVTARTTRASGAYAVALGNAAAALADQSSALGTDSQVASGATNAVALGVGSYAGEADTVSLGHAATDVGASGAAYGSELRRRLVYLADGITDSDAASIGQLRGFATALGGGSTWSGGVLTAPSYSIQGSSYSDVGAAFSAVDTRLTQLGTQTGSSPDAVEYDAAAGDTLTLKGASGTRVSNVADGQDAADAVNKGQMDAGDAQTLDQANAYADAGDARTLQQATDYADAGDARTLQDAKAYTDASAGQALSSATTYADAGDAQTLQAATAHADAGAAQAQATAMAHADAGDARTLGSANAYTDQAAAQTLQSANAYTDGRLQQLDVDFSSLRRDTDRRFAHMDRRIDRIAAMGSAMAAAAMNTAGLAGDNRLGVGVGAQGGQSALAVGYQRLVTPRSSVSLSAGFAGDDRSVSAGAGFSW